MENIKNYLFNKTNYITNKLLQVSIKETLRLICCSPLYSLNSHFILIFNFFFFNSFLYTYHDYFHYPLDWNDLFVYYLLIHRVSLKSKNK